MEEEDELEKRIGILEYKINECESIIKHNQDTIEFLKMEIKYLQDKKGE